MASPPLSLPGIPAPLTTTTPPPAASSTPPPAADSSPPPPSTPPPTESPPPPPPTESPPPPTESPPPPTESPPPPVVTSPPPSPPESPPPTPTVTPPPQSPPPPDTLSPPPAASLSPPPPPPAAPSPSSPSVILVPPPAKSPPSPDNSPPPPSSPSTSAPPPSPSSPSTSAPPPPPSPSTSSPPPSASKHSPPSPSSATTNSSSSVSTPTTKSTTKTDGTANSTSPSSSNGGDGVKYGVAIGIVSIVVVIGFIMGIMYVRRRKRKDRYNPYIIPTQFNSSPASGSYLMQPYTTGSTDTGNEYKYSSPEPGIANSKAWFSYDELSAATNGFSSQNILGAGGFGCVYKGYLQDGREVAVKRLKAGGGQGDREFKAEVEIISRVHHRHLVTLVGYCINEYQRLLVYEFVPNNTLDHHLHGSGQAVMEWNLRVKAAAGSARGIAYLHEDCHPRIIHRDIKSANILLDNNFEAKVADFGLAKLAEELDLNTHVSTRVMGTFGYMAPEYASSGKLTEKSDVFSFGVVLLELITGRKPVDQSQPLGDESLVEWARPLMTKALDDEDFDELADPRLEGTYDRREMFRMIEAAAACVRHSASKRPKMSQVVRAFDLLTEASTDLSNGMRPGQSEIFDSREQSAQIRMFQRMAFGSQDMSSEYSMSQASWRSGAGGGH